MKLELEGADISWAPLLEDPAGVRGMLEGWLADMQGIGSLVQQLQTGEGALLSIAQWSSSQACYCADCSACMPQETTAQRLPRTQPLQHLRSRSTRPP